MFPIIVYVGVINCILIVMFIIQWYYHQEHRIFNPLGCKILIGLLGLGTIFMIFDNITKVNSSIFYWIGGELILLSFNALFFRYRMKIVQTSWHGQKIQKQNNWHHSGKINLGNVIYKNNFSKKFAM
ncbi:MAG: hypothetical protein ACTSVZ_10030, partial [Promethearchaeota archaeon]